MIFHLAAVVSGEAEADLELGYRVNLDGTRLLLDAIRQAHAADGYRPRVVFTSSLAVFGPPLPRGDPGRLHPAPASSYGTQKAMGELLLADYARRGFLDGIGLRLPTICVRPGQAQQGGLRLLLRHHPRAAGRPGGDPAGARHRAALVRQPRRGHRLPAPRGRARPRGLGPRRSLTMPGVSATVAEEIEALRRVGRRQGGGADPARARRRPSRASSSTWPEAFEPEAALGLGFRADASFDAIVAQHVAEFHGG